MARNINTHEDSHPLRVKYKNITLFIEFKIEYKNVLIVKKPIISEKRVNVLLC